MRRAVIGTAAVLAVPEDGDMKARRGAGQRALVVLVLVLVAVAAAYGLSWLARATPGVTWTVSWDVWTAASAVGTIGATAVALWLAVRGIRIERDRASRVVSAWVSDEYLPDPETHRYRRKAVLHVANESDEPVFGARVSVLVGEDGVRLGPLAAPSIISVIPPRRELKFDISTALRAHEQSWMPRAELFFKDPHGRRWLRNADGDLREVTGERSELVHDGENDMRQVGDLQSQENPLVIAMMWLEAVRGGRLDDVEFTSAPEADGWQSTDWAALAHHLRDTQPTSFVDYPAASVARVKVTDDVSLQGMVVRGEGVVLDGGSWITLTRSASRGWRVFAIGRAVRPDDVALPDDAFG